jgi:hypothetical protein
MLRNSFFLVAALAAGVFGLGTAGCGDDSSGTGGGGTGGGDTSGTGAGAGDVELSKPPARPDGAGPGDGADTTTIGVSALFLGDTDRSGTKSPSAWQGFGYDLDGVATVDVDGDGKITGADLEGKNCAPVQSEANAKNLEDGPGGIDNSFGRNIVSFIGSVLPDPSNEATAAIEEGSFTIALEMETLGTGANYDPIPTSLYAAVGGDDGTWEIVPELLDASGEPLIKFPNAYVVDNTWVSGEPQTITLNLAIAGVDLSLNINNAVIAVKLNGDRSGGSDGVIAGVLETEALVREIGEVASVLAGDSTEGLCPGDTLFDSVMQTIRNASDIMKDGTQNAGATCDGISIAIGFDAQTVVLGEVAEPSDPQPSSCE